MKTLAAELKANFDVFSNSWPDGLQTVMDRLKTKESGFRDSYFRIASLQAWRAELIESSVGEGAFGFFLEAQNDALISHVFAGMGTWRAALKSLRSCLENILFCLYYKDHPIELELWLAGKHRISFRELEKYFREHPSFQGIAVGKQAIDELSTEYSTLSKAVHASAKGFRMAAAETGVQLWVNDPAKLGAWQTRQKTVIGGVNQLLLVIYRHQLSGTAHLNLRKSVSMALTAPKRKSAKEQLAITLPSP